MKYKKKILKNGMRVIVVPMKDTHAVTVLALVEAGSNYESKEENGLSHFLEHMVFKGTEKRPGAFIVNKELDGMGAQTNAFTAEEFTGYYAKAAAKHLPKILDVISDLYLNPVFPEAEIEKEKGVIVQEIKMYEDMPHRMSRELFDQLLYGDQPAGRPILGPEKNIMSMTRQDFVNYRNKHYVAEATTLIVSGKCEPREVFVEAEKAFKSIAPKSKAKKVKVRESQTEPQVLIKDKKTDQNHLALGVRAYKISDKRLPAMELLAGILGGGMSSRLFQRLREEMGVCYYVRAYSREFTDHGYLSIATGVDTKRTEEVVEALLEECRRLVSEPVSEDELKKAKEYLVGNMYLGLETSDSLAEFYGIQEILKRSIKTEEEIKKEIMAVTAKDVQKVAKDIFKNKGLNLAIVGKADAARLKKVLKL